MNIKRQDSIQFFLWFVGFFYTFGFLLTQFEEHLDFIDIIKIAFFTLFFWPFFLGLGHGWS